MNALNDLQAVMFQWKDLAVTTVKPILSQRPTGWYRIHFIEDSDTTMYNQHFDRCVSWVEEKIKDWPDVKRMAFDMWDFKNRKDAEKFITLFHLSCQQ